MTADRRPPAAGELPDGWVWTTLGDIVWRSQNGFSKRSSTTGTPTAVLRLADISENRIWSDGFRFIRMTEVEREKYLLARGDLLIIRVNGSKELVGQPILFEEDGEYAFCDHFIRYSLLDGLALPRYVSLYLRNQIARDHIDFKMVSTAGQNTISQGSLATLPVVLPPLAEQRRIVARIEALFAQSRRGREALDAIPGLLTSFRQAVLAAAFRGQLTQRNPADEPAYLLLERIRAERRRRWEAGLRAQGKDPARRKYKESAPPNTSDLPELPEGWVWTALGQLLERIDAGRSPRNQGRPAGLDEVGVLKVSAVTWGEFLPEENKALLPEYEPGDTPTVESGDLLISRANTTSLVGAVVLVKQDYPNLMLSDKTLRLVPISEKISQEYLLYALRTQWVRDYFASQATGTSDSMRNISQTKIRSTPTALAPLAEQRRIVARVEALFAQADALEAAATAAHRRLGQVDQAILARAFRGELVPQDPADEPASVLLERIRKQREGNEK